jgi:hypothetical protein
MTNTPARRRLRSASVALGLTALAAGTLTGCAAEEPDYQAICVDPSSQERVDDNQCGDDDDPDDYNGSGSGFFWFYMASRSAHPLPAVGSSYNPSYGTYKGSSLIGGGKSVARGGAPARGATTVKSYTSSTMKSGGFGGKGISIS